MDDTDHALVIITYSTDRYIKRLPVAVKSLINSGYPGDVFIVDDGSVNAHHSQYLRRCKYEVIYREKNGGVSKAKNTALKLLQHYKFGFIAEDDVLFKSKWWEPYLEAHSITGIHHFSWTWNKEKDLVRDAQKVNEYFITKTSLVNGCFLTVTPEIIKTVGGFKVLPAKWGHEHTNWTRRIIRAKLAPYFCDILHSNNYIGLQNVNSVVSDRDKYYFDLSNAEYATSKYVKSNPIKLPLEE